MCISMAALCLSCLASFLIEGFPGNSSSRKNQQACLGSEKVDTRNQTFGRSNTGELASLMDMRWTSALTLMTSYRIGVSSWRWWAGLDKTSS